MTAPAFPPITDKIRFPLLATSTEIPLPQLMGCDGLVFFAPSAQAFAAIPREGTEWHLYGDTRWPAQSAWVEFDTSRVGFPDVCGILVLSAAIPTDESDPIEWAARNDPLQQVLPATRGEQAVKQRLEMLHQVVATPDSDGPPDVSPKFAQGYCIFREERAEVRMVACYSDLLNAVGIPIPKFRMADVQPCDVDFCRFALHGLFSLNRARLAGASFLAAPQLQEFAPVYLAPDQENPRWAQYHPSRVLRARPAVRALPTPADMVQGAMQMEDFKRVLEVRRAEETLHMLGFARVTRARGSMFDDGNATMAVFTHRANGGAIYVLPDRLVEEFDQTDCDEVRLSDVKMPFTHVFLRFTPPEPLFLADGAPVDGCYVARQSDEYLFMLTSHWEGVDYARSVSVTSIDPTFSLHLPTNHPEMCVNAAVELGIQDFIRTNAPPSENMSQVLENPDGTTTFVEDIRAKSRKRRIQVFKSQEPVFRACLNIVVNALCFISFRPEDITEEWEGEPPNWVIEALNDSSESRRARDRRRDAVRSLSTGDYVRIRVCGKGLFDETPKSGGTGHGVSPRAHWRRGHWRRQRHGVGLSLMTLRWIRPTIVKKDNGPLVETRIYDVQRSPTGLGGGSP